MLERRHDLRCAIPLTYMMRCIRDSLVLEILISTLCAPTPTNEVNYVWLSETSLHCQIPSVGPQKAGNDCGAIPVISSMCLLSLCASASEPAPRTYRRCRDRDGNNKTRSDIHTHVRRCHCVCVYFKICKLTLPYYMYTHSHEHTYPCVFHCPCILIDASSPRQSNYKFGNNAFEIRDSSFGGKTTQRMLIIILLWCEMGYYTHTGWTWYCEKGKTPLVFFKLVLRGITALN